MKSKIANQRAASGEAYNTNPGFICPSILLATGGGQELAGWLAGNKIESSTSSLHNELKKLDNLLISNQQ